MRNDLAMYLDDDIKSKYNPHQDSTLPYDDGFSVTVGDIFDTTNDLLKEYAGFAIREGTDPVGEA